MGALTFPQLTPINNRSEVELIVHIDNSLFKTVQLSRCVRTIYQS